MTTTPARTPTARQTLLALQSQYTKIVEIVDNVLEENERLEDQLVTMKLNLVDMEGLRVECLDEIEEVIREYRSYDVGSVQEETIYPDTPVRRSHSGGEDRIIRLEEAFRDVKRVERRRADQLYLALKKIKDLVKEYRT